MKRNVICIAIFLSSFLITNIYAQNNKTQMGVYNVGFGALTGGIGAVINKKADQKFGAAFLKGAWRGAMGGTVIHCSKLLAGQIGTQNTLEYSWLAKTTNSLGTSIVQNAIYNKGFLEQVNLNIGFNHFTADFNDGVSLRYRIMPVSLLSMVYVATQSKFEPEYSLRTGEFIFSSNKFNIDGANNYKGFTLGNIIVMRSNSMKSYSTFGHEIIHVYQYYDYDFVNSYTNKLINRSDFLKKYSNFFYYDLQAPVLHSLYLLSDANASTYYGNFYEREAGMYSNTITSD